MKNLFESRGTRRLLSLALSMAMVLSLLPAGALAEETESTPPTCDCEVLCAETVNESCPVCGTEGGQCAAVQTPEPLLEERESQQQEPVQEPDTETCAHGNDPETCEACASEARVASVQALIVALPEDVTAETKEAAQSALSAVDTAKSALTAEEQALLDMTRYTVLTQKLAALEAQANNCAHGNAPETCEACASEKKVAQVQALIDALPDAQDITLENAEEVIEQMGEIDEIAMLLTEAEQAALDNTKYEAAAKKLAELAEQTATEPSADWDTATDVSYLDASGAKQTCSEATVVTSSTSDVTWTDGWYVVQGEVTIGSRITVSGDVHLILADGCVFTVNKGISVNEGNSLTIYAQSTDETTMGSLTATGNYNQAAIGGTDRNNAGTITINGGKIKAEMVGINAAGIGGGRSGSGGTITINGGIVEATGGSFGAGIGGGQFRSGGSITINGGTVKATGGQYAAGIGGGQSGAGGEITINGGDVTATSGESAAGIGGGKEGAGGTITINGGKVNAKGRNDSSGIGGGWRGSGGTITINGGEVTAAGGETGTGIGDGKSGSGGTFSTNGGSAVIFANSISDTSGKDNNSWSGIIFEGNNGSVYGDQTLNESLTIDSGKALTIPTDTRLTIGKDAILTNYGTIAIQGTLLNRGIIDDNGTINGEVTNDSSSGMVMYLDKDGKKASVECTVITEEYLSTNSNTLSSGWYVVKDTVTIGGRITVSGDVKLILADGCNFTVNGGIGVAGGQSLTIYAQSEGDGMGKLFCQNNDFDAGIGGTKNGACGSVLICGGDITSTGGGNSAGIGGSGNDGHGSVAGTIAICGGTVRTFGGNYAPGIGSSISIKNSSPIQISGGTVYAQGGTNAAGIGGGGSSDGGTVTITGGTVTAIGKNDAPGIGGGERGGNLDPHNPTPAGNGADVTITNAFVTANGIGGPKDNGTFSVTNSVVVSDYIKDSADTSGWNSIVFLGNEGKVYGNTTLSADLTIPADKTLTIPEGASLTIGENATLTNYGTIAIVDSGKLQNNGSIVNYGTMDETKIDGNSPKIIANYLDANGKQQSVGCDAAITADYLTANSSTLSAGWYVVQGKVTIGSRIKVSGDVHLILENNCNFTVSGGIQVLSGNSLTIYANDTVDGTMGSLTAQNVAHSYAGIGSDYPNACGTITINGGNITATGGYNGAGIGGGSDSSGGIITINGGNITATGGSSAAGIGGGSRGDGGKITITGGTINANLTKSGGAGIGGGQSGSGGEITISGGDITANGGLYYAGIGGGSNGAGGKITITGGNITATGDRAAGIGGGRSGDGGTITISGGNITATGGDNAAGIGGGENHNGGTITISGGSIDVTGGKLAAGIGGGSYGAGGTITISNAEVIAKGGNGGSNNSGGAGIGGGNQGFGGTIEISNSTIKATGGENGAGIGGGNQGAGGTITINGGNVNARGTNGAAGIGSGSGGSGGTITISGGKVTATGGTNAAGIGDGHYGAGGTFSTTDSGRAVIFASSISDQSGKKDNTWRGIIFEGSDGQVYGNQTPTQSFEIPTDKNLLIPKDIELDGAAVTNSGTVYVGGTLTGTLSGNVYYPLTVTNGTASGDVSTYQDTLYGKAGGTVTLTENYIPDGKAFTGWQSGDVTITEGSFTMPSKAVSVTAQFADIVASVTVGETISNYVFLRDAFAAASDAAGSTLTLLTDATADAELRVNGSFTLDLNGKKLDMGAHGISISGSLTVEGAEATSVISSNGMFVLAVSGNGALTLKSGTIENVNYEIDNCGVLVNAGGTATIEGGKICSKTCIDNAGTLKVKGGTLEAYCLNRIGLCIHNDYDNGGSVTITGGTLDRLDRSDMFNTAEGITLQGGSFPHGISFTDDFLDHHVRSLLKDGEYAFYNLSDNTLMSVGNNETGIRDGVEVRSHTHSFTCEKKDDFEHAKNCACGYSETAPHDFHEGDGFCKVCDAYQPAVGDGLSFDISNAGQLFWFADYVNNSAELETRSAWGQLQNNISIPTKADGTNRAWTPIGTEQNPYRGSFYGNGHSISGLYFEGEVSYASLFGVVGGPESRIENLTIGSVEYDISVSTNKIAGICGFLDGGRILNCTNLADISCHPSNDNAAGICYQNNGTISGCTNAGEIHTGDYATAGGICVINNRSISECTNEGAIHAGDSAKVGGICVDNNGSIEKCTNTGAIQGGDAGGICADNGSHDNRSSSIENCANRGQINGSYIAGGICARNVGTVSYSYHSGSLNGGTNGGPIVGEMRPDGGSCFNCYYQADWETDDIDGTTAKTEAQFASGEVAYLLCDNPSSNAASWGQTIGEQNYPVLNGERVYRHNSSCPVYSNSPDESGHAHTPSEHNNRICKDCGAALVATVRMVEEGSNGFHGYVNLQDAFAAANEHTATITLLKDVNIGDDTLTISGGNVTFESDVNHDAAAEEGPASYTITTGSADGHAIEITGGTFNFKSGTLQTSGDRRGIFVLGGTLNFQGGTIAKKNFTWSIHVIGGMVNITDGTIDTVGAGQGSSLNISGGTIHSLSVDGANTVLSGGSFDSINTSTDTVSALLANGYAYKLLPQSTWVDGINGIDGATLDGGIQVLPIPVKIDTQPVGISFTYGDTDKKLTVAASGSSSISYQWYQNDNAVDGATGSEINVSSLNAGIYKYFCRLTCDGYVLDTHTVTVTVNKVIVTPPTVSDKVYSGQTQTADVTVGTDTPYTVEANPGGTDVGAYSVTLKLKDAANYKWSDSEKAEKTINFQITKSDNSWTTEPAINGWTYGSTASQPIGAAKFGTVKVEYSTDGTTYSEAAPTKAGSYKARFSVAGTDNYAGLSEVEDFTISPKDITVTITPNGGTYGGTINPATAKINEHLVGNDQVDVTLTYTGKVNDGTDYNSTVAPTKAGTYTVTASISDTNYTLTGKITATFVIGKATVTTPTVESKVYNGSNQTADVTVDENSLYTLAVNNGGTEVNVAGYPVEFTLKDSNNYQWDDKGGKTTFAITKAGDNTWTTEPAINGWTYGGTPSTPAGAAKFGTVKVEYSADGTTYSETAPTKAGSYTARFTVEETKNYNGLSIVKSFSITEKALTVNVRVADKQYDGLNTAAFDGNPSLVGVVETDDVKLKNGTPTFSTVAVDKNIPITFTGFSLVGADKDNYTLTQPTGITASIYNSYTAAEGTDFTTNSDQNWMNESLVITAVSGHQVSTSNLATSDWQDSITMISEGVNKLTFYVRNGANGAISEAVNVAYKVDKTAPTGTICFDGSDVTNSSPTVLFKKENVAVTLEGSDALSGVASVRYFVSDAQKSDAELKALTDWTEGKSFTITAEDSATKYVYGKVVDKAGNVTYVSADYITFDTTAPSVTGVESGATYHTTQTVTVSDTNLESMTLNGTTATSPITLIGNKEATYTIVATDKAGNVTTVTVTMKPLTSLTEDVKTVDDSTVTKADKVNLEAAKKQLENQLTSATEEEKQQINKLLSPINDALNVLQKVEQMEQQIQSLPTSVKTDDEDPAAENAIKAARTAYDGLSAHEKELVDAEKLTKLTALESALVDYKIISGDGSSWYLGSGEDLTFTANGPHRKLKEVKLDDSTLDLSCASGSTIITLKVAFMQSLAEGSHTLQVVYTDGATKPANFEVKRSNNYLDLTGKADFADLTEVWVDGVAYPIQTVGGQYVTLPENSGLLTSYSYQQGNSNAAHENYPTGMEVYELVEENGTLQAQKVEIFTDLLKYEGCSIRITGKPGIRMITSIDEKLKKELIQNGYGEFKLVSYGTVAQWKDTLKGNSLTLSTGNPGVAYDASSGKDPIFGRSGGRVQYTNVLVWDKLDDKQYNEDIIMRPFIKLRNGTQELVIYGGTVSRSIGYVAQQNANTFPKGSAGYNYVHGIINKVNELANNSQQS